MGLYGTEYANLSDQEKELWDFAFKVLQEGQRLYGTDEEDVEHLGWALGLIVRQMRGQDAPSACYFELVHDESGYGLSLILPEPELDQEPSVPDSSSDQEP